MNIWPVQHAKAHFSELLNTCIKDRPQMVTRRGEEATVLISIAEWRQLNHSARLIYRRVEHLMYLLDTHIVSELRKPRPLCIISQL